MAVIGISIEPTGRTRVLFDFRACAADGEVERIERAMMLARPAMQEEPMEEAEPAGTIRRPRRVVPAFR